MNTPKIIISSILVVLLIIGTTYAWWTWNSSSNTNVSLTVDGINVTYDGGSDITGINLIPVSSKEVGVTNNTAIKKTITVSSSQTLYMDLNLKLETLPDGLKDKSFVWEIYNDNTLVGYGNFDNKSSGNIIELLTSQTVTNVQTIYNLYIWIDGTQNNPNSMMNQTFKFVLSAEGTDKSPPPPNSPDLVEGLIPVMYSNDKWVKADSTNANATYKWYDYDNKQWANAVLVSNTNRTSYKNSAVGTIIQDDDILAYYVWIPRYKYKVWNIKKIIGYNVSDVKTRGIDIVFEKEKETTGTIICKYYVETQDEQTLSEGCNGEGSYYTHPAFTFGEEELRGIWIGKYELSSTTADYITGGVAEPTKFENNKNVTKLLNNNLNVQFMSVNDTTGIRIKENLLPLTQNTISSFWSGINKMTDTNNEYGLNKTTTDSHMIKNIEWGAIVYFTHSKYGRCIGNVCETVKANSYKNNEYDNGYKTGCGSQSKTSINSSADIGSICNEYNSELGQLSSTTGNVYGIYDLAGGANEYVMANMSSSRGSYLYNEGYAGNKFIYSSNTAKYIDIYTYGSSYNDQKAYNRTRLGDATGEIEDINNNNKFVGMENSWLCRGGYDEHDAGIFDYRNTLGGDEYSNSTRAILILET